MLSHYCERLGPDFWAEPLNAVTNAAFILAGLAAYLVWRSRPVRDWPLLGLIGLVFAIGIGSFLFHTRPGPRTVLADVVPIQLFVLGYLAFALRRMLGCSAWQVLAGLVLLIGAEVLVPQLVRVGQGSEAYLPALVALFAVGLALIGRAHLAMLHFARGGDRQAAALIGLKAARAGRRIIGAGMVFTLSLGLRALDVPLCARLPSGTHFLWHLLNALTLLMLLLAALSHDEPIAEAVDQEAAAP
jgi:hypothetical protein